EASTTCSVLFTGVAFIVSIIALGCGCCQICALTCLPCPFFWLFANCLSGYEERVCLPEWNSSKNMQGFSVFLSSHSCRRDSRPRTGRRARGERCRQPRVAGLPAPLSSCEQGFAL